MNKKLIFSVLLVVCLLAVVAVVAFGQNSPSQSVLWEYTSFWVTYSNGKMSDQSLTTANGLGKEGWELIGSGGSSGSTLIFKRRLP